MMKRYRKLLALILAVVMLAGLFAGCSGQKPQDSQPANSTGSEGGKEESSSGTDTTSYEWEFEEDTSPFEFTVWWPGVWAWAKGGVEGGWDTDIDIYRYITERTGGRMNIDMPSGTQDELAGAMIASGTYPDCVVFDGYNNTYINQMISGGLVYSWSSLIDEYASKMWELIPESMLAYHADENGELWKYVGFAYHKDWVDESREMGNYPSGGTAMFNVIFCREDTLEAFGKDDITDLDTFTEYLGFVRKNFPELDPIQLFDGDPRGTLFTHMRSTFGCHLSGTYPQSDGTVKFFMYDPAYVDYLSWLNGLYRDGVITDNQLTDDASAHNTKLYSASYGATLQATYTVYNTINTTLSQNFGEDSGKLYTDVGPIQKEGVEWKTDYTRSKGSISTLITKNSAEPDRIIKFFEFLFTDEGQKVIMCGLENTAWWYNEDGTIAHEPERAAAAAASLEGYVSTYRVTGNWAPWCNTSYWEGLLNPLITPAGRAVEVNDKRLGTQFVTDPWEEGFASLGDCIEAGSDLAVINTKVNDSCRTAGMRMITAKNDEEFRAIYDACIAEIEGLGVAQLEAALTAEHQKQCQSLGIEP